MGKSLQDQFLKMGLVDKKKYNTSKKEAYQKKKKGEQDSELKEMAQQALAEKKQRELQQNKKKRAAREAKEATARARQLIETHKIAFEEGDVPYNFTDNNKIKKLFLDKKIVEKLASGKLGIVKLAGEYQFVPADTIYKIKEHNENLVILHNSQSARKGDEEDPYDEYEIPDDLMW